MVTGAMSLSLVRNELFTTIDEAEQSLEQFIVERQNGSLLQQAVVNLQQVRGILKLIELTGAEMLAQEVLQQATNIPAGVGEVWDVQLAALSGALHVLRRYLESVDLHRQEIPELLLPAINDLRLAGGQAALPESLFFSVRLDAPRPPQTPQPAGEGEVSRLRHMYQLGLLGFIREQSLQSSIGLMLRAMKRLERIFAANSQGRLYWICAAALESHLDGGLIPRKSRKFLFAQVDRELRRALTCADNEPPRSLLKELLYLVALADSHGPLATQVREAFVLQPLPFTDQLLEEEYRRLAGPGQSVMRSLSMAICEELTSLKDSLDLIERGASGGESLQGLYIRLGKLVKTLSMVGLISASNAIGALLPSLAEVSADGKPMELQVLTQLAEALLYVEGVVTHLERGERALRPEKESDSFASQQLAEARIVVLDEAKAGLALARRAITAYIESNGDKMHLANVPISLDAVRGGLWFLEQQRAATLILACGEYIQKRMLESQKMPAEPMLETLADALTSLEYYLEGGAPDGQAHILDLASDSVSALALPVAA